jgi:hypothetical protein
MRSRALGIALVGAGTGLGARVDGAGVQSRACDGAEAPPYCRADRVCEVPRLGDALDLEFDVPDGAETIELRAAGYSSVPR